MIGGKTNQAYFFYGYAGTHIGLQILITYDFKNLYKPNFNFYNNLDDELLYMDPHVPQPYVPNLIDDMQDSSYHTNITWKMKFSQLDPSVAIVRFSLSNLYSMFNDY